MAERGLFNVNRLLATIEKNGGKGDHWPCSVKLFNSQADSLKQRRK